MKISTLISTLCIASFLGGGGVKQARAQAAFDCLIGFDDAFALSNYYKQARDQFGVVTRYNPSTQKLEFCSSDDWTKCWAYRQRCSYTTFYVNFWPWNAGDGSAHSHLWFENPKIQPTSCFCDPHDGLGAGFGFYVNGACNTKQCPNWAHETRSSATVGHL